MANPLDFTQVSTWEIYDPFTIIPRIAGNNPGSLAICANIFKKLKNDSKKRGQFFFNCEKIGLSDYKVHVIFKNHYNSDCEKFLQAVLKTEEALVTALLKINTAEN